MPVGKYLVPPYLNERHFFDISRPSVRHPLERGIVHNEHFAVLRDLQIDFHEIASIGIICRPSRFDGIFGIGSRRPPALPPIFPCGKRRAVCPRTCCRFPPKVRRAPPQDRHRAVRPPQVSAPKQLSPSVVCTHSVTSIFCKVKASSRVAASRPQPPSLRRARLLRRVSPAASDPFCRENRRRRLPGHRSYRSGGRPPQAPHAPT